MKIERIYNEVYQSQRNPFSLVNLLELDVPSLQRPSNAHGKAESTTLLPSITKK